MVNWRESVSSAGLSASSRHCQCPQSQSPAWGTQAGNFLVSKPMAQALLRHYSSDGGKLLLGDNSWSFLWTLALTLSAPQHRQTVNRDCARHTLTPSPLYHPADKSRNITCWRRASRSCKKKSYRESCCYKHRDILTQPEGRWVLRLSWSCSLTKTLSIPQMDETATGMRGSKPHVSSLPEAF